jgi:hypothetical protein
MEYKITPQQFALYSGVKQAEKAATERVNLVLATILGGHGLTEGNVEAVMPDKIVLADEAPK